VSEETGNRQQETSALTLRLAHLYPKLMNIYGDRGNILCLRRRCEQRGIGFEVTELELGDELDAGAYDLIFIGGAQDREQRRVADDLLATKAGPLREAVERDVALLAVCGGYQLMGRYYRTAEGEELPGVGLLDLWTEHPGPDARRFIGNVVVRWAGVASGDWKVPATREEGAARKGEPPGTAPAETTLVGFENHGGRTYLGEGARPLAKVVTGYGNNGADGYEGATYRNAWGTYLHGSLLPKNPRFADHVIQTALRRRYPEATLAPLDDFVEEQAHAEAVRQVTRHRIIKA
jgi:CobQ-like glutamine amidotransferase family enzyme